MLRLLSLAALTTASFANAKIDIDPMKHYVQEIYDSNFDNVIGNNLPRTVSAVWYFRKNDSTDKGLFAEIDKVAEKTKKMITIAAMDCSNSRNTKRCAGQGMADKSGVVIYPQQPRPKFQYEGDMTSDAILKFVQKLIPGDKVKILANNDEYAAFKKGNPTRTKVVLFHDKKTPSPMFKGLSTDTVFARTVEFAFVGANQADVAEQQGAKKKGFPALQIINKGKTQWYKGKKDEFTFEKIHEWVNLFSESGMGDTVKGAGAEEVHAEEPEYEKVRELHAKSQGELCFKQKNVCAIYLHDGAELPDAHADAITNWETKFAPKSDRAIRYNWMWMDVSQEPDFKKAIEEQEVKQAEKEGRDLEPFTYPTMIFVKPPKKKREEKLLSYIRHPAGAKPTDASVGDVIELISGGAMYTRVDLPRMAVRAKKDAKKDAKKGKKEEL